MVLNSHQKPPRATQPSESSIPRSNTLFRVAFHDGQMGFMAMSADSNAVALFDTDGGRIYSRPGCMVVVRRLGEHLPCDPDAFRAQVTGC